MIKLKNIGLHRWQIEKQAGMKANVVVFAKKELIESIQQDQSLIQLAQTACLPQVISPIVGMPDIHQGFGLPIGGVMATKGLISSGAVGMDINCGVRLLLSQIEYNSQLFSPQNLRLLIKKIEEKIPVGLGRKRRHPLADLPLEKVISKGVPVLVAKGYGEKEDITNTEENGQMKKANPDKLSSKALKRAEKQLGTLGSGNHFIEVQVIEEILDQNLAKKWGLFANQVGVMIHTGSRALGHQTCLDYTQRFFQEQEKWGIKAPVRDLASLPITSPSGKAYFAAMAGCVNFAFANRQLISHFVRQTFQEVFKTSKAQLKLLYDVAHNIAKWEIHQEKRMLVHRKGATRALPANHPQNPPPYLQTGHPAIVPGSMGSSSYVMVGLPQAKESFFSINHGAGRAMSRHQAKKTIQEKDFQKQMEGIVFNQPFRVIADEAPQAYKNINLVVDTLVEAKLAQKVCRLRPLAVIKGD